MPRRTAPHPLAGLTVLALTALAARTGHAANEEHVRTPVLWQPAPTCGLVVQRAPETPLHLDYAIPYEDTQLTADELDDSRTHQFLALCRDRPASELLPLWVTRGDVDRSVDAGLLELDPGQSVAASEILDEHPEWSTCARRITADDARRPITFQAAAQGVDWDLDALPLGVWLVAGYTFEPALNLWSPRPGFMKIIDDPDDPAQDLPALAITSGEQVLESGGPLILEGCADALAPATITLEWAPFAPDLDWRALPESASSGLGADGAVTLAGTAPQVDAETTILVRATLTDALGRSFVAHTPTTSSVRPCVGGCGEGSDDGAAEASPGGSGCAVEADPKGRGPRSLLILGCLALFGLVRRPSPFGGAAISFDK